jgi:hypothetical protein
MGGLPGYERVVQRNDDETENDRELLCLPLPPETMILHPAMLLIPLSLQIRYIKFGVNHDHCDWQSSREERLP